MEIRTEIHYYLYVISYKAGMMRKKLVFTETSLDDLRAFPHDMRPAIGYQLDRVQQGTDPHDWKPFSTVGAGGRAAGEARSGCTRKVG